MRIALLVCPMIAILASAPALADSDLDPTWNVPSGYTVTPTGAGDAVPNALAIDSVGRIVAAGYSHPVGGGNAQFAVVRYVGDSNPILQPGAEDATFNSVTGAATPIGLGDAFGNAMQIGAGDGVVVAGDCTNPTPPASQFHAFCLARFTSAGVLDGLFGSGGTVITLIGPNDAFAKAMTTDSTGSFLVAGWSYSEVTGFPMFTVARYNGSGSEDSGFAGTGFAKIAPPGGPAEARAYAIAVDSNGYIIVAGVVDNATYPTGAFGVIRLTPGGLPDPAFNGGEMFVAQIGIGADTSPSQLYKPFFSVTVDKSNRPVVVGTAYQVGTTTIGLLRLTTAGSADPTFGSSGKVSAPLPGCPDAFPTGVQVDASGGLFVSAQCSTSQQVLALVHYNANGSLDSAYGSGGYETEQFGSNAGALAVVLDPLGRPIDVGFDYRPSNSGYSAFVINRHDYVFSHGFE